MAGQELTPLMQVQLQAHGVVPLMEGFRDSLGREFAGLLAVDADMKRVVVVPRAQLTLPEQVHGVTLTPAQRQRLLEGRPARVEGMTDRDHRLFNATVQLNPVRRVLTFRDVRPREGEEQKVEPVRRTPQRV